MHAAPLPCTVKMRGAARALQEPRGWATQNNRNHKRAAVLFRSKRQQEPPLFFKNARAQTARRAQAAFLEKGRREAAPD